MDLLIVRGLTKDYPEYPFCLERNMTEILIEKFVPTPVGRKNVYWSIRVSVSDMRGIYCKFRE